MMISAMLKMSEKTLTMTTVKVKIVALRDQRTHQMVARKAKTETTEAQDC